MIGAFEPRVGRDFGSGEKTGDDGGLHVGDHLSLRDAIGLLFETNGNVLECLNSSREMSCRPSTFNKTSY